MTSFPHSQTYGHRPLLEGVRRLTLDQEHRQLRVELTDGRVAVDEWRSAVADPPDPTSFREVTFDVPTGTLMLTTTAGETLRVEVHDVTVRDPLSDRKVIYLDQNKWVQLAQAKYRPGLLSAAELAAAETLVDLVNAGQIVLPLSSGHMIETGRLLGRRRGHLAPLLVDLCRGWLMANPVLVRGDELTATLCRRAGHVSPTPQSVFTLDASTVVTGYPEPRVATGLPDALASLTQTLTKVTALFAALVADESTDSAEAREAARLWAAGHQELAVELARNPVARAHSREVTRAKFLTDLGLELPTAAAAAGLTPLALAEWLRHDCEADIAASPFLGLMREVVHLRLRNGQDRWAPNDLIDMLFLCCAGAYADVVVAENKTADYLRRARRAGHGRASVCSSLVEAVSAIR